MSNTTTITGNLTREPEIRYTKEGQATTQLGVAVNRRWQDRTTNEWQEATSFFDVVCWRDLAENVALSLTKGMRVVVTGRIEQRSWETDDGEHRSKVEIVADEIGPSLRFATADVRRVERRAGGRINFLAIADFLLTQIPQQQQPRPCRGCCASRSSEVGAGSRVRAHERRAASRRTISPYSAVASAFLASRHFSAAIAPVPPWARGRARDPRPERPIPVRPARMPGLVRLYQTQHRDVSPQVDVSYSPCGISSI